MKKTTILLFLIICSYVILLFIREPAIFSYKFQPSLIKQYLCSQDIPYEPPCHRLFVSDGDIYVATGYLYAHGADPTTYNFQMPPFIKYLFGFSTLLFGNPYYVQIIFGISLIILVYKLGIRIYKSPAIPLLACFLLVVDPVFFEVTTNMLLDLGQTVFLVLYVYLVLFHEKKFYLQGAVLGLLFASKFWAGPLFFVVLLIGYLFVKKRFHLRRSLMQIVVAGIVFSLTYARTFMIHRLSFNLIFFQLKTLKYMISHDVHSVPLASFFLFLTGYLQTWWNTKVIIHSPIWSIFWPVGLILSLWSIWKVLTKKSLNSKIFIACIPALYIIYLGVQAPFTRYFMIILPFLYLLIADRVVNFFLPTIIRRIKL